MVRIPRNVRRSHELGRERRQGRGRKREPPAKATPEDEPRERAGERRPCTAQATIATGRTSTRFSF